MPFRRPPQDPVVRVELIEEHSGPVAPAAPAEDRLRRRIVTVAVGIVCLVLFVSFIFERDNRADVAAPLANQQEGGVSVVDPSDDVSSTEPKWREFGAEEIVVAPMGDFLSSPVKSPSGWLALRRGVRGNQLVRSSNGLEWELAETALQGGNLFGLGYSPAVGFRTLVNSASLSEQRFTLSASSSVDGTTWLPTDEAPHVGFGNLPAHVSIRGGTTAVVGDRPLEVDTPPPALSGIVSSFVSPELAEQTCDLTVSRSGEEQRIDLLECDGSFLGSIADDSRQRMNTFATISFLLQFQQVVTVQVHSGEIETIVLPAGNQVVAIEATDDGFVAVVIDSLAGVDPNSVVMGPPPGRLMRWTGNDGLVDVTDGLSELVDLTSWWDNDLVVAPDGRALLATSTAVFEAEWPYDGWTNVSQAPSTTPGTDSILKIGPLGSGIVFEDSAGHIWLGRIGEDWVRAPSLDGGVPREVLLSTDDFVFAMLEYDSFSFRIVRAPLPATGATS